MFTEKKSTKYKKKRMVMQDIRNKKATSMQIENKCKMTEVSPSLSIITFKVNELNFPIKGQISRVNKNTWSNCMLFIRYSPQIQRHKQIESKRMGKDVYTNTNQKRAGPWLYQYQTKQTLDQRG